MMSSGFGRRCVLFLNCAFVSSLAFLSLDAGLAGAGWVACAQDIYELDLYHKIWPHDEALHPGKLATAMHATLFSLFLSIFFCSFR